MQKPQFAGGVVPETTGMQKAQTRKNCGNLWKSRGLERSIWLSRAAEIGRVNTRSLRNRRLQHPARCERWATHRLKIRRLAGYDYLIMKCPHCLVEFHDQQTFWSVVVGADADQWWILSRRTCPGCNRFVLYLENGAAPGPLTQAQQNVRMNPGARSILVWPKGVSRAPVPQEVPPAIVEDYKEACLVLADSPKASAALSRRCLQNLLRQAAGVKPADLSNEIQQVLDSGKLPPGVADNIDAVRNIGNFGAHPNKSKSTGEVVDVEPHEAEWNLDVLESLFDFYFVQPARAKARRDALNKKLQDAGKPPLK